MNNKKAILILAAVAGVSTVYADKVTLSATPQSVQQAIRSRAGSREIEDIDRDTRNGQVTYEASWKNASGAQQDLTVAEGGNILKDVPADPSAATINANSNAGTQPVSQGRRGWRARYGTQDNNLPLSGGQKLTMEQAPESVRTTITQVANGAQIEDLERGTANGRTIYQAAFKMNGQNTELQVYDDGSLVRKTLPGPNSSPGQRAGASGAANWQPRYAGLTDALVPLSNLENMSLNQAPRPVQQTVTRMANGSYISGFEKGLWNGRTVYDAQYTQNGQFVQLEILEDGSLITKAPVAGTPAASQNATTATGKGKNQSFLDRAGNWLDRVNGDNNASTATATTSMSLSQAPAAVQQTVNQTTQGASIQSLQQEQWNGRKVYSATYPKNGQTMRVQVLEDGSILNLGSANAVGGPATSQTGSNSGR